MLIKITNKCGMGCSHCMENSTPAGGHMTMETFKAALAFTRRTETAAWLLGCAPTVLLSGGEPTEHPDVVAFLELVIAEKLLPILITNGTFLADDELRAAILRPEWPHLLVQVTNDQRYYPSAPPRYEDERVGYVDTLKLMFPMGRFKRGKRSDEVVLSAPSSFNLRSAARELGDFAAAVCIRRLQGAVTLNGQCSPSVTHEGDVVAGESRGCWKLGTVHSSNEQLTKAILEMGSCNRCGLESELSLLHRRAIGLSALYGPDE